MTEPAAAVTWFRGARKLARLGTEDWCTATLALAEALHAAGHTAGAADILRVAGELYPKFGSPELRKKLKGLTAKLGAEPS